jgi:sugar lactone lactonase YvrE
VSRGVGKNPRRTMNTLASLFARCVALTFATAPTLHSQTVYEPYAFATLAGIPPGKIDGSGAAARFQRPYAVASDSVGNVYVADIYNHTIRKVTPDGTVTTLAGVPGDRGYIDSQGAAARFAYPNAIAIRDGILYVADGGNAAIRKITADATVSTVAGGTVGTGSALPFYSLAGIAVDNAGNIYVTDNQTVRRVTPAGAVSTMAGNPNSPWYQDGQGSAAYFNYPQGIAVNDAGTIFVADTENHAIRFVTPDGYAGTASYFPSPVGTGAQTPHIFPRGIAIDSAGSIYVADTSAAIIRKLTSEGAPIVAGAVYAYGSADGDGTAARFFDPVGLTFDPAGNLIVADASNATIRKISPSLEVSTLAGRASPGIANGPAGSAQFGRPAGVARDRQGNVYVADTLNHTIRKITPAGVVSTFAGSPGEYGAADGNGSNARFATPKGVAVGPGDNIYVADTAYSSIRKITPAGDVSTVAVLNNYPNYQSWPPTMVSARPEGLAVDSSGSIFVAGTAISAIIKITPAGEVSTFAGQPNRHSFRNGTGMEAWFNRPCGIAVDSSGNLYVADTNNRHLRKITPHAVVTSLPSGPNSGSNQIKGVAVDGDGNVFFATSFDAEVRKLKPSGEVTMLGGLSREWQSADGVGSAARFSSPSAIAVDAAGRLYVADTNNNTIRIGEVPLALTNVVSRKTHGSAGTFDVALTLSGAGSPGLECRSGGANGNHTLVFTFNHNIANADAAVTSGAGTIANDSVTISDNQVSVDLTGVANAQTLTLSLTGVTDDIGQTMADTTVSASFLQGDTNGNGSVNATDIGQTKASSGQSATTANFRSDVSVNGSINATDLGIVKSSSGTVLP